MKKQQTATVPDIFARALDAWQAELLEAFTRPASAASATDRPKP